MSLGISLCLELLEVDDETFVLSMADEAVLVVGLHLEDEATAVDLYEGAVAPDLHAHWSGGGVCHIDECADGAFAFLEERGDALAAGLLDEGDHHRGGEDVSQATAHMGCGELGGNDALEMSFDACGNHKILN